MKFATTFGSSTLPKDSIEYQDGILIGNELARRGYRVKCGGYQGLMEAVSIGVNQADGVCIGECLEEFEKRRPNNIYLTQKNIHKTLFSRLEALIQDSELFIAQRGSLGTLNEVLSVWTLLYTKLLDRDIRLCLIGREWSDLFELKNLDIEPKLYELLEFYPDSKSFLERL